MSDDNQQIPRSTKGNATFRSTLFAVGLIVLQSLLYGFGDPISKIAYESVSVYSLLSVRYLIALVVLLLFASRQIVDGMRRVRVRIWLIPSLCIAGCYIVSNVALELSAATSVAFLRSLSVVMTPLLAFVLYRTKYRLANLPILVLMIVGMYLICAMGGVTSFGLGEVLVLISDVLTAVSLVVGARALLEMDPIALTAAQVAVSVVMAAACAIGFEGGFSYEHATPISWAIIVYLAVGCTLVGFLLQNIALRYASASTVAMAQCLYPVMTAFFSYLILGERLTVAGMVGAAIVVVCVFADARISSGAYAHER